MKFGVCYYPEHWPEARWAIDAQLMGDAGLEIVRIAEFAWAKMEPVKSHFEWDWLDRAIDTLASAGLQIILGTPTATPPAWLTRSHPDILRQDANGRSRNHGTRRHYCPNSPTYHDYSRRIVTAIVERYGSDGRVIGWQTDNELGGGHTGRCYCDNCAVAFRHWLQARYGQIDALNEAWGTIFWSQTYNNWDQINPPRTDIDKINPSHELDYFRFCSDSIVSYQQIQLDIIRPRVQNQFVTHNFMGLYLDLDQFDLAEPLDFVSWDAYYTGFPERWGSMMLPPGEALPSFASDVGDPLILGMAHDLMRGLKQRPFWIMEQQAGHINWGYDNPQVRRGTPRLWCWHALASGANTIVFFRWRATLFAQEQYHSGLLRHDGSFDVGWHDLKQMQAERDLINRIAAAPLQAPAALLFDYDDLWALELQPYRRNFHYLRHLFVYYRTLQQMGVMVDLVSSKADLSAYKLVISPTAHTATSARAVKLKQYVEKGGTLLLGIRSGFKTASNLVTDQSLPGTLRQLAGTKVVDWQSLPDGVRWEFETTVPYLTGPATYWAENLEPDTAQVLASYETGMAALTENLVGKGRVLYLGFYPTPNQASALITYLAKQIGIKTLPTLPFGMLAMQRGQDTILLNFSDGPLTAVIDGEEVSVNGRDISVYSINPNTRMIVYSEELA